MKSLSELQASLDVGPLERVAYVCVAGKLVDEYDRLTGDLVEYRARIESLREEAERRREGGGPPQRSGQTSRLAELEEQEQETADRADALRERIRENSVAMRLRADEGKWRRWVPLHSARDEQKGEDGQRRLVDPTGYAEDAQWARGLCNVADLVANLHEWVVAYNDEPPSEQWWAFLRANAAPGDMVKAASTVVGMHVNDVDLGKSRGDLLADRRSLTASE